MGGGGGINMAYRNILTQNHTSKQTKRICRWSHFKRFISYIEIGIFWLIFIWRGRACVRVHRLKFREKKAATNKILKMLSFDFSDKRSALIKDAV